MNVKRPDRPYKSDRLNYIVNRMRVRQDITPAMLADELHVSERTIYRDLRHLEKGNALKKRYSRREGRYLLETEPNLAPMTLTPTEALALFVAASNPALAEDNFFSTDLRSSLSKLASVLAPDAAREVETLDKRVVIGSLTLTADNIQRPTMELIRRAMRSNRKLCLKYWSASSDQERDLIVAPYDLRFMRHNWYLLAYSEEHSNVRTFKLSRIRLAQMLTERFRYPRRFSADAYFARAWEMFGGQDDEITVTMRFSPAVAALVQDSRGQQLASVETQADGGILCTALVNSVKEISWWILSFGANAEVLSPPELRAEFARTAQALSKIYAEPLAEA